MLRILQFSLIILFPHLATTDPSPSLSYNFRNVNDELYEQPVNFMGPKKSLHAKDEPTDASPTESSAESWSQFDFSKFDSYLNNYNQESENPDHNRIKRRARRRGRGNKRRSRQKTSTSAPDDESAKNGSTSEVPIGRSGNSESRRRKKAKKAKTYDTYESPMKSYESSFVEMPKDLYQAHLRPGVIFRIHMSEAILKMQYRNYGEDKDESVIEADVEYLRLTRKVINDEITKFEDLQWLNSWFLNRSELIEEHMCNTRYYAVGTPPTMFTTAEEYMKRLCLFDGIYIDHIPYVVGEDSSLMAAVAPPVLHCDAATCTSVPFIDSIMFDERFSRTNVRTLTRCQASCRAHCRNDPDCLKRCSDRCLRSD